MGTKELGNVANAILMCVRKLACGSIGGSLSILHKTHIASGATGSAYIWYLISHILLCGSVLIDPRGSSSAIVKCLSDSCEVVVEKYAAVCIDHLHCVVVIGRDR